MDIKRALAGTPSSNWTALPRPLPFAPSWTMPTPPGIVKPVMRRVKQMSESHCGPAVLEMLLSHLNIHVDQAHIAAAVGANAFIYRRGMRVDELARAIAIIRPDLQLWYKTQSSIMDLKTLTEEFKHPVAVEWQGLFYDTLDDEFQDTQGEPYDFGHYSIVKRVDIAQDVIVITDPYIEYYHEDRMFSLRWFEKRWWDENEVEKDGMVKIVKDEQMLFVVTHRNEHFPELLAMTRA